MVGYLRRHHLALLALFVALGGTSYAAIQLSKNSVSAKHIKRSAVRSAEVKDLTLRKKDFKPGQVPGGLLGSRRMSGSASSVALPGNMGTSVVTPVPCRTDPYTAGPGEVAVINLQATGSPSAATNSVLYLKVMASENAAAFAAVSGESQADTLNVVTTHVTNSHVHQLTAGTSYQWGAGLASNVAVTLSTARCSGNVTIYRSP